MSEIESCGHIVRPICPIGQLCDCPDGESLIVQQLQNGTYTTTKTSQFFANLSIPDIADWLQRSATTDYLMLVKAFRGWVRSQLENNDK